MDDLIRRQDVIGALTMECSWIIYDEHGQLTPNGEEIIGTLKKIPSAQKKGHWIDEGTNYYCSECHRGCWVNSDYCPWCGADMREVQRF